MQTGRVSAWAAPAAWGARGPRLRDALLMSVAALAAVIEAWRDPAGAVPILSWSLLITLAVLPGLLWRRTHPLAVVVAMTALGAAAEIAFAVTFGRPIAALGAVIVMLAVPYALFRWGSGRARIVGAPVLAIGIALSLVVGAGGGLERNMDAWPGTGSGAWADAIAGLVVVGGACLLGVIRRQWVESRAIARDRERGREREALARDLHDTVAHHVSAIAIRAQAAQAMPPGVASSATAFAAIEVEAREALAEMRSLVTSLRTAGAGGEPAPLQPLAGLDAIRALAEAGPPAVEVHADDAARAALASLPLIAQNALFRIAQEAVSNARRHARNPGLVRIRLAAGPDDATLTVVDDGEEPAEPSGDGYGIRGMIERATALGGEATAGPTGNGWRVFARVPRGEAGSRDGRAGG